MSTQPALRNYHTPDRDAADAELLARLNHGDATAFRAIFDAYAAPLVLYAQSLLRTGVEPADDIVHDLFTYLWMHRHTLEVESALRTYLYRATRNRCWSVLRHERVKRASETRLVGEVDVAPVWQHTDSAQRDGELATAIARALETLPDRPREIWRLNRVDGLSYAEIAKLLGLSVKTIETHMTRALRTLRVALKDWRA